MGQRTVTKADLCRDISATLDLKPEMVRRVLDVYHRLSVEHLINGRRIEIRGYGVFQPSVIRNPSLGGMRGAVRVQTRPARPLVVRLRFKMSSLVRARMQDNIDVVRKASAELTREDDEPGSD